MALPVAVEAANVQGIKTRVIGIGVADKVLPDALRRNACGPGVIPGQCPVRTPQPLARGRHLCASGGASRACWAAGARLT